MGRVNATATALQHRSAGAPPRNRLSCPPMDPPDPGAREWLEADGAGGFASGTADGIRTRRYHALLLDPDAAAGRFVLVNGIEAWVDLGEPARRRHQPALRPRASSTPTAPPASPAFTADPWPTLDLHPPGRRHAHPGAVRRRRPDQPALDPPGPPAPATLHSARCSPGRDYHALHHENPAFDFATETGPGCPRWRPYPGLPPITAWGGAYQPATRSGIAASSTPRNRPAASTTARTSPPPASSPGTSRAPPPSPCAPTPRRPGPSRILAEAEAERARRVAAPAPRRPPYLGRARRPRPPSSPAFPGSPTGAATPSSPARPAADALLRAGASVRDAGSGDRPAPSRTVASGRADPARLVRPRRQRHAAQPLPRRRRRRPSTTPSTPASGSSSPSTTCCARRAGPATTAHAAAACTAILDGYRAGTRYGIGMDPDGLIRAGAPGLQLTWMDAKVGDWVVTPRIGKPVEIQALWINALRIAAAWPGGAPLVRPRRPAPPPPSSPASPTPRPAACSTSSTATRPSERRIRPNQIFAVGGLPHPRRPTRAGAARVVDLVEAQLLTPLGLRTLDPADPAYRARYAGGPVRARRRLPPGHRLALAARPLRRGLAPRPRQHPATPARRPAPASSRRSTPTCRRPASATSARSWTATPRTRPAAARSRPGRSANASASRPCWTLPPSTARRPSLTITIGHLLGTGLSHSRSCTARSMTIFDTAEGNRLQATSRGTGWRRWGPYLSERQWGTVREDYSPGGTAWDYFPHDHARMPRLSLGRGRHRRLQRRRASTGASSVALWNGHDPILKERLFGLTNSQGNHGEDVKELYYYLDAHADPLLHAHALPLPAGRLPLRRPGGRERPPRRRPARIRAARHRHLRREPLLRRHRRIRQGLPRRHPDADHRDQPRPRPGHRSPSCRSSGPATPGPGSQGSRRPLSSADGNDRGRPATPACATCSSNATPTLPFVFCENETNVRRLYGMDGAGPFKDGINDFVVHGDAAAHPPRPGHQMRRPHPLHHRARRPATRSASASAPPERDRDPFIFFDAIFQRPPGRGRRVLRRPAGADRRPRRPPRAAPGPGRHALVQAVLPLRRPPLARRRPRPAQAARARRTRNRDWRHLNNADVISMPDKWEYPWYAAWDLAFHCATFALIDPDFAKDQLLLMLREWYMHPNGQIPAYEWAFGDVNPPVHAWAAWRVFEMDRDARPACPTTPSSSASSTS